MSPKYKKYNNINKLDMDPCFFHMGPGPVLPRVQNQMEPKRGFLNPKT